MLQAAYVTKNSFAASDSATIAGRHLPARGPLGNSSDFCRPCMERYAKSVPVSDKGRAVGMCEECFTGVQSKAHRESTAERFRQIARSEAKARVRYRKIAQLTEDAIPYFAVVNLSSCAICGLDKIPGGSYCDTCRDGRALLLRIKSWLRSYQKAGDPKELSNAMGQIRRYNIQPEDFRYV